MIDAKLQIVVVGGDPSVWVAISARLPDSSSRIIDAADFNEDALTQSRDEVDAIVVVTSAGDPDPLQPLRVIQRAGMNGRTLVLADAADHRTAGEALDLGVAGYLLRGSTSEKVAGAIEHILGGGSVLDAPAAAVRRTNGGTNVSGAMGAARALASALELKDTYTGGHAERVTAMAMRLAKASMLLDVVPADALEAAFLLHDVGKIGVPDSILNKSGVLTDTERRVLETHPILGERIIAPLGFPHIVREVVRHHHERWDGRGYPDGLAGFDIPAPARVFAVADVIDAMTSIRPYRQPVTFEEALDEIKAQSGKQFDPALCELIDEAFHDTHVDLLGSVPKL